MSKQQEAVQRTLSRRMQAEFLQGDILASFLSGTSDVAASTSMQGLYDGGAHGRVSAPGDTIYLGSNIRCLWPTMSF